MDSIVGIGFTILIVGILGYILLRAILHWPLRRIFGIGDESFILKDLHTILIGIAAIVTAALAIMAYDKLQQSLNISLKVDQVKSNKSDKKTGLIITLSIENNGLSQAVIKTASNQKLLKVSKINYELSDPENLYSTKDYYPYYFYSIGLLENGEISTPSETVYERSISRGETKNISFYVEVDNGYTYHISSLLGHGNLYFQNQVINNEVSNLSLIPKSLDRNESEYTFFESIYIHTPKTEDTSKLDNLQMAESLK